MVREARLREIVRLEYDLPNITPHKYFEMVEYWLRDIEEGAVHDCIHRWADVAAELSGACQIASRAVERSSSEWALIKRWIHDGGTRQKAREGNAPVQLWSMWWFNSWEDVTPLTTALDGRLEPILRCTQDLKETIERLGSFWDELSSDIKAVPLSMMLDNRASIISSGRGTEMINQWAVVSDLIKKFWIDRRRAVDLVRLAPPGIRSTGMGQYTGLPLRISVPFLIIDYNRIISAKSMKPVGHQYYHHLSLISMSLIHCLLHPP